MGSRTLTRREAAGRAALVALAALLPDAPAAAARRRRRRSGSRLHCLSAADRFAPVAVLAGCSFAAFSPDGRRLACTTAEGVEIHPRDGGDPVQAAPAGFRVLGSQPWHPAGDVLLASGPGGLLAPAEAPFALRADGSGATRLLGELPGRSRALSFSPDGRRVAFTYLDGIVHRVALADWAGGGEPRLERPRVLLPFDPRSEQDAGRMMRGLAWHETRGFSPDGGRLLIASDRGGGMLNVQLHALDLASGRIRHLTRDDGFAEGAVAGPGETLLYGSTRAREPALLTAITGPQLPPFLGFAATPALHDALAPHAPVGNGDVLAADLRTGLRTRLVARRDALARAAGAGALQGDARVEVCSLSPDGRELAVAVHARGASSVVILRRAARAVPPRPELGETPVPPTAAPLEGGLPLLDGPIERTLRGRYAGEVALSLRGTAGDGAFAATLRDFVDDGTTGFDGELRLEWSGGELRHEAQVRRLRGSDAGEDGAAARGGYSASLTIAADGVAGRLESRWPRGGPVRASGRGGRLEPEGRWRAGRGPARDVPGAGRCRRR